MNNTLSILIADGLGNEGLDKLRSLPGVEVVDSTGISRDDLIKKLPHTDILIVRSRTEVDKALIESAGDRLKIVVRAGIGLDNIDVETASDRGVVVMNAPTGNTVTTAEHAIAMMFSVSRRIPAADASMRAGKWEKKKFQGSQLAGKTLGVVGLGKIGKTVAKQGQGLGMKVIGFDPYVTVEHATKNNIRLVSLEQLYAESHYITLHVPLIDSTQHLISDKAFALMKNKPYLINCARGGIVDEKALENALEKGQISGVALDVFETEPPPAQFPLYSRDNVVVTPHLGASTDEAQTLVGLEVAEALTQYVVDGVYKNAVNVPNLSLEQLQTLKPFIVLCERLGAFVGNLSPKSVSKIIVHYEGAIAEEHNDVLTLSVLKGYLTPLLSTAVNFVNARQLSKDRGVKVEETFSEECANFASLVTLTVEGSHSISCAGSIFGKEEPRIVSIDGVTIDAIPAGCLLYTRNYDHPGVIGWMGTTLGTGGINISRMALGLDKKKNEAIALINIDSEVPQPLLQKLSQSKDMITVQQIFL